MSATPELRWKVIQFPKYYVLHYSSEYPHRIPVIPSVPHRPEDPLEFTYFFQDILFQISSAADTALVNNLRTKPSFYVRTLWYQLVLSMLFYTYCPLVSNRVINMVVWWKSKVAPLGSRVQIIWIMRKWLPPSFLLLNKWTTTPRIKNWGGQPFIFSTANNFLWEFFPVFHT